MEANDSPQRRNPHPYARSHALELKPGTWVPCNEAMAKWWRWRFFDLGVRVNISEYGTPVYQPGGAPCAR